MTVNEKWDICERCQLCGHNFYMDSEGTFHDLCELCDMYKEEAEE